MRKRGSILSLETLVILLPRLLVIILVIAVLVVLYTSFWMPKKTPVDKDFERVIAEIKDLQNAKEYRYLEIPLGTDRKYDILIQSPDSSVSISERYCPVGSACLCVLYEGISRCEKLPALKKDKGFVGMLDCPTTCGGEIVCVPDAPRRISIEVGDSITLKRTCNEMEISVT